MRFIPDQWQQAIDASFFGRLPPGTVADLFERAREVDAAAKTILYSETNDQDSAHLVLVLSGLVRVYRTSRSGREITLRHARKGDVLGLPSIVAEVSPAAAQAVVPTKVVLMSPARLRSRAKRDGHLAWAMAEEIAGSLFNIQDRLAHNIFAPVRSRVARYLLDVAMQDGGILVARASHDDIAAAIGTVREVVARTLTGLRNEGLTSRTDFGIVLVDVAGLRAAADADQFREFRTRS